MEADWAQKELSFYFETLVRHSKTRGSGEPFESPLQKEDIGSFEDAIPQAENGNKEETWPI